jgi:TRAP-type C4-dicarboxylate transport system permease small subunit
MINQIAKAFSVAAAYAQGNTIEIQPGAGFENLPSLTPQSLVSGAISLLMLVVAIVFFFMLVWGGLKWIMAQGDQKAVETARGQITNALIGLAIVFSAWAIVKLIEVLFGISLLNLEIPTLYGSN